MSSLPRNMNLKAFDPHRTDFTCKHEAEANPPITKEAEALFQQGMAATSYVLTYPDDKRDYAKAAVLWKRAADIGNWKAALNLAGLYETGQGVEQDTEKAVQIVEGLMKRGVPAAFDKMGTYHQNGIGVKGDISRAYGFWQLAADMGSSAAQAFLGTKTLGTYDNPGQGFWGNRAIALKMLECSYAQGNGNGAFELGVTTNGDDRSLGEDYGRALKTLHDAVKFGSSESAGYMSASFNKGGPLVGSKVDTDRADRYHELRSALEHNPDLRLPNLDKVLPLPPAELPSWDGKPQTLIDAAKGLVPAPAAKPTAGSQRTGRAHIPQGHVLRQNSLPPVAERAPLLPHQRSYVVEPQAEQSAVPYSGYWVAQIKEQGRTFQREWNEQQVPLRYTKGETFAATERRSMGEYARHNIPQWHYLGEAVPAAKAPTPPEVIQGIARVSRVPEPYVLCRGQRPCPRTGIWFGDIPKDHPLASHYNRWDRQAYLEKGQAFPDPQAMQLDIAASDVRWLWCDNANQSTPNGLTHVTLTDLHDAQGRPVA